MLSWRPQPMTVSSDSMTAALMTRLVDRRASVFDRIILRALIRAAIDVTCEERHLSDITAEQHTEVLQTIEQTVRDALAMVRLKA